VPDLERPRHGTLVAVPLEPRPRERVAFEVVRRTLGTDVEHRDDGSNERQGEVDAHIIAADGERAALEVTVVGDQASLEVEQVLVRPGGWTDPHLRWRWDVRPGPRTRYADFAMSVTTLAAACELAGITDPEALVPSSETERRALEWYRASDCPMFGNSQTSAPGTVDVLPPSSGGAVDEELNGLDAWLVITLASGHIARRIDKLNRSGLRERHLFLILHESGVPFPIFYGLAFKTRVPREPPSLPDGVTHLWLFTGWRDGGVLRFEPAGGWLREQPYA